MSYKDLKICLTNLRNMYLYNRISRSELIVLLDFLIEVL